MKVGDLVRFHPVATATPEDLQSQQLGLIIETSRAGHRSYKIWWMAQSKAGWPTAGWWDAIRLEKVE